MLWERLQQRADDVPIDLLQRLDLLVGLSLVGCLIRRFHVDAHQIVVRQSGDGGATLGGIIRVEIARRSGHVDALPAKQYADTADKIDGADYRPAFAVYFGEWSQRWRSPLTP